jgi:YVTN family beta-propeller protein
MSEGKFGKRFAALAAVLTAGVGLSAAAQPAGAATQAPARHPAVTRTIPVGSGPIGVAVSPMTGRIYVTNSVSGTVSVINGRKDTVVGTIPIGGQPSAVAVSPRTCEIYVTDYSAGTV